jgi:hypothetical protein
VSALTGQVLGVTVRLSAEPALRAELADWFQDLLGPTRPTRPGDPGGPVIDLPVAGTVAEILTELTAAAVAASPLLCMHAGVVSGPRGLLTFPGFSGLGKTTLTACLVRAGFGYVSDEALALDRPSGRVSPFARPLGLSDQVWPLFDGLLGPPPPAGTEGLARAAALGTVDTRGGTVHDIILATRVASGAATIEAGPRGEAVQILLTRSFNHFADPAASFRAVVTLVRAAQVWRVRYSEAPELAALLADHLGVTAR